MSDDAITKERIEAIGFQSGMYGLHFFWLLIVDTRARNRVYVGRAAHGATPTFTNAGALTKLFADFTAPQKPGRYRKEGNVATWIGD